jgi:hypothetical protein
VLLQKGNAGLFYQRVVIIFEEGYQHQLQARWRRKKKMHVGSPSVQRHHPIKWVFKIKRRGEYHSQRA